MLGAVLSRTRAPDVTSGLDVRAAVATLLAVQGAALLAIAATTYVPPVVTTPVIVFALTLVPGSLVLLALSNLRTIDARWLVYAVGLSLVSLLAVGFLVNLVGPVVGVARPLSTIPLTTAVTAFVVPVAWQADRSAGPSTLEFATPPLFRPIPLALLALPLVSVLAVSLLNRTGTAVPILATLVVLAVVPLLALVVLPARYHSLAVWTTALAVLYHKSLWKYAGFAGSPGVVRAWEAGRWTPGFEALQPTSTELLQNGVLFPTYASLARIDIFTQLEVVNPLFVSVIPVAMFVAFRRYVGSRAAVLGAGLFVVAHPFYLQYPTAGRAATPVLFLALFGVVLSDRAASPTVAAALSMLFLVGVVVSHYGTAYFVAAALVGAVGLSAAVRFARRRYLDDQQSGPEWSAWLPDRRRVLSVGMAGFFVVSTISWYLYLTGGRKFELLPRHSSRIVGQLLSGSFFAGRTTLRIQRDYGTPSVRYSKYVYLVLGILIAIGLAFAYYRYVFAEREPPVDATLLSIGTATMGLFGLTILFRTWGGGRPMMITFVFTAVFAPIGAAWLGTALARIAPVGARPARVAGLGVFAVLLVALLLLNTGVVSSLGLGGYAASNVPLQAQIDGSSDPGLRSQAFQETDVATHAWLVEHHGNHRMYGDSIAHGQTDWKLPQIEARTRGLESYGVLRPRSRIDDIVAPGVEDGYVVLLGHNLALDLLWDRGTRRRVPLATIDGELRRRHRVYTTGNSAIYYANGSGP